MLTTITIRDTDKKKLKTLKAKLRQQGVILNMEDIISLLIDIGVPHLPFPNLTVSEVKKYLAHTYDLGSL